MRPHVVIDAAGGGDLGDIRYLVPLDARIGDTFGLGDDHILRVVNVVEAEDADELTQIFVEIIDADSLLLMFLPNELRFDKLTYEELRRACISLQVSHIGRGGNVVLGAAHVALWSWCGQVLFSSSLRHVFGPKDSPDHIHIKKLAEVAFRAAIADSYEPTSAGWEMMRKRHEAMEHSTRQLVQVRHLLLAYLAFPLLEATLKKTCSDYVQLDGTVIKRFKVPGKTYDPNKPRPDRVSNLGHLLWLLYRKKTDAELKETMDILRQHISTIDPKPDEDPFNTVYRWRNSSAHGATPFVTIGTTIFNLAILIMLHGIKDEYDAEVDHVRWLMKRDVVDWFTGRTHRTPWSYFPLYFPPSQTP